MREHTNTHHIHTGCPKRRKPRGSIGNNTTGAGVCPLALKAACIWTCRLLPCVFLFTHLLGPLVVVFLCSLKSISSCAVQALACLHRSSLGCRTSLKGLEYRPGKSDGVQCAVHCFWKPHWFCFGLFQERKSPPSLWMYSTVRGSYFPPTTVLWNKTMRIPSRINSISSVNGLTLSD